MATITPWTSATPELFLNAARAGAAVGSDIAGRRQQAAMAAAQMAQQANLATLQAAQEQNSLLMRAAAARQEQEMANALNMEKLRVATQESALDRALREREINARISGDSVASQLRKGELDARIASDAITQKRALSQLEENEALASIAQQANAAISSGVPIAEVARQFPAAMADPGVRSAMQILSQNVGPVTPGGVKPFRVQQSAVPASTNAPTQFIIRGVR
jgi:hypothetical protein